MERANFMHSVIVVIDNMNVVRAARAAVHGFICTTSLWGIWARVSELTRSLTIRFEWCPSHRKRPDWRPDRACNAHMAQRWRET
eukprot:1479216-Karenia_brevis.AAC.1